MFEFAFPIFCFGAVMVVVVVRGLFMAAEMNRAQLQTDHPLNPEEERVVQTVTSLAEKLALD